MSRTSSNSPSGKTLTYLAGLGSVDSLKADNLSRHNRSQDQPPQPTSVAQRLRALWRGTVAANSEQK